MPRIPLLTTVGLNSYKRLKMPAVSWSRQVFCTARCTTIVRTRATPCKNLRPKQEMMRYVPRSKSVDSRKWRVLGEVPPVKSEATGSGRGWLKDVTRLRCFVELNSVE